MSIATELQNLNGNILDAYTAIQGKGGTMPAHKNMVSLSSSIDTIPSGGSFIGIPREVDSNGVYKMPSTGTFSLPSDATDVGNYALYQAFYWSGLTSANLSSLTTASGSYAFGGAFNNCARLTSVDLSSLTTVSGSYVFNNTFSSCTHLTSVDLSSLTAANGSYAFNGAFYNCTRLTSVDLSSLTAANGNRAFYAAFNNCTSLASVNLSSLAVVGSQAFARTFLNCRNLQALSFPSLTTSSFGSYTDQFNNMLYGVTGCTVHFPLAIQSTIGSWSDVTNGFGGTNTTVLFDL